MKKNKHINIFEKTIYLIKNKYFQRALTFLFVLLISLFIYKFIKNNFEDLKFLWSNSNLFLLLLTFPVFLLLSIAAALMWSNITKAFGVDLSNQINIRIYLLTLAARRLPGSFLHVIGRISIYRKLGVRSKTLAFISGLEILLIVWSGIIVSIISSLFFLQIPLNYFWILILGLIISSALLHPKTLNYFFHKLINQTGVYHKISSIKLLIWLIGYMVIWVLGGVMLSLIVLALSPHSLSYFVQILTAWTISGISGIVITFLPSGLGVVELTLSLILNSFLSTTIAISVALASRILQTIYDFLISAFMIVIEKAINPKGLLR